MVNMRTDPHEVEFSIYLLKLGEGSERTFQEEGENKVTIPEDHITDFLEILTTSSFLIWSMTAMD